MIDRSKHLKIRFYLLRCARLTLYVNVNRAALAHRLEI